jgi:hypothetical protein
MGPITGVDGTVVWKNYSSLFLRNKIQVSRNLYIFMFGSSTKRTEVPHG